MLARAGPILARLPENPTMVEVGVWTALLAEHLLKTRSDIEYSASTRGPLARAAGVLRASGDTRQPADSDTLEHMRMAKARLRPFGERAVLLREWSPEAAACSGRRWLT